MEDEPQLEGPETGEGTGLKAQPQIIQTHSMFPLLLFQPIKICILGPPAVGKSSIAEELTKYYKLHHIKIKDVISEAIAKLVKF